MSLLSIGVDVVILGLLGGTIFFSYRLSRSLNNFRKYRQEMNALITELNKAIKRSEQAIDNMKGSAMQSGGQLQEKISDAAKLHDELELITEMAEGVARRLEAAQTQGERRQGAGVSAPRDNASAGRSAPEGKRKSREADDIPSFFIQDRDYDLSDDEKDEASHFDDDGSEDVDVPANLQSKAERELYKALQKNKQTRH